MRPYFSFALILLLALPVFSVAALESPRRSSKESQLLAALLKREAYLMRATNLLQRHRVALLHSQSRPSPTEEHPGYFAASLGLAVTNLWEAAFSDDAATESFATSLDPAPLLINPAKEPVRHKRHAFARWQVWSRAAPGPASVSSGSIRAIDQRQRSIDLERALIGALMGEIEFEAPARESQIAIGNAVRSIRERLRILTNQARIPDREHRDRQMIDFEFQLLLSRYNAYAARIDLPLLNEALHVRTASAAGHANAQLR